MSHGLYFETASWTSSEYWSIKVGKKHLRTSCIISSFMLNVGNKEQMVITDQVVEQ
jgi:hypothetical protein